MLMIQHDDVDDDGGDGGKRDHIDGRSDDDAFSFISSTSIILATLEISSAVFAARRTTKSKENPQCCVLNSCTLYSRYLRNIRHLDSSPKVNPKPSSRHSILNDSPRQLSALSLKPLSLS